MPDYNDTGFRHHKDFQAWEAAKRTHQLEHASGVELSLPCDVFAHYWNPEYHSDEYGGFFGDDLCRKFCIATGRPW